MRKYSDYDREKSQLVRFANIIGQPCPDYPGKRENGVIIQAINKQIVVVDLIPEGRCDQWLAVFPNGELGIAGMNDIHAELRRIMPPAGSVLTYK